MRSSKCTPTSEVSSSSPKIVSKDATATAAVAVKKKRKRTEDKWANFVSIPSLPKPDPISDNEIRCIL